MLKLTGISKSFGPTVALRRASLEVSPGDGVALLGENGAGKSTLIRIASGCIAPDEGTIEIDGRETAFKSPQDAISSGIGSVYQELSLVGSLSVEENLFLVDQPVCWHGAVNRRARRESCRAILDGYGLEISAETRVDRLPVGEQQRLEVVRVIRRSPSVLLLDEATSALGEHEVEWLVEVVRALRRSGVAVVFISHRWDEVALFANRVVVLRNGEVVHDGPVAELSQSRAVRLMSGQDFDPESRADLCAPGLEPALEVENLVAERVSGVTLSLQRGEIVGVGGLVGQGQQELLRTLFGLQRIRSGSIRVGGRAMARLSPKRAISKGLAYVPQERRTEGLVLDKSISFNMTLSILRSLTVLHTGIVRRHAERALVRRAIGELHIRSTSDAAAVSSLSGGNQQKVLLQKWLMTGPQVLLLDDVTRGVDIATKATIYRLIAAVASAGVAVLMYSTDALELKNLSHRVLVMREGAMCAELQGENLNIENIVHASVIGGDRAAAV